MKAAAKRGLARLVASNAFGARVYGMYSPAFGSSTASAVVEVAE